MSKQQARARLTHQRALQEAGTEFARHGFADASLLRIAQRMNLTKGALYGHFNSKAEIAAALVALLDELLPHPGDPPTDPHPDPMADPMADLQELALTVARAVESDIQINAALRLTVDDALDNDRTPPFLEELHRRALELQKSRTPTHPAQPAVLADLLVIVLVGAYYTAPTLQRSGMSTRVQAIWDALTPHPSPTP
ncbi:TetR/AcrR family transcriptional regulator [Kitasatospora herbaricolor]|uniref:TetR/AcrR family transcriptional regulator n=1 Tax=Kitasatospora herbaricolor TaxID=68217 RepID=A0ABZ1W078_9ACTN|nr:TetR/AcrR family transcriptional regulator [Kitasatospora herbaricolor]